MTGFEISITINKPIDIVAAALNNADNFPYWQTGLERFEVVKGGPNQVGSIGRLHYSQKGRSYVMEDRLMYCEPGKKYISEVEGDAIFARVETTLHPLNGRTGMVLNWSGKGKTLFLRLFLPFLRARMVKQAKKELEMFKQLVEERGADFSKLPEGGV
ncbi:MAG: SRPBCC family protein [candidate division WOR-3 bacterium]|nr:MAG: SRPBCC family protein [candidate division WOR-3 bacterium]